MNKVYVVEMHGYDDYQRYGIFAELNDAREMLQKFFHAQKAFWENNDDYQVVFIDDNKFVLNYQGSITQEYFIKEEKVL